MGNSLENEFIENISKLINRIVEETFHFIEKYVTHSSSNQECGCDTITIIINFLLEFLNNTMKKGKNKCCNNSKN